ncbi:ATP-grasp domain-containing protein [Ferrimicrobium acidiphilum]|uniref:Ribosomal protein S6--L-glutamate ligase n=1 Tax=Ferrimicrobium acidiphilum DSM 19497 TaxID=1121877 RepID=A0A0D8FYI9_9ACTN|nr:ATP-grasp domain-containing protein [Ferrimicrobium acidiphilum]KJE78129.1 ribosomal protein S6--L-glutamate ligase [Ferrimicrobium acidiphilum DSM 19497]MCL5053584.1 ATP-grasp domain-containing protein [Gammaproteobacteria bacterium]
MAPTVAIYYDRDQLRLNSFFLHDLVSAGRSFGARVIPVVGPEELRGIRLDDLDAMLVRSRSLRQRIWLARRISHVVNSPLIALLGNDKLAQYLWCKKHGFATPELYPLSTTPSSLWVAKPRFGHGGQGVRRIQGRRWHQGGAMMVVQQFVVGANCDHRHYVVGTTVVATVERKAVDDFRSNLSLGATVNHVVPDERERDLVRTVVERLGAGYYGVDTVSGPHGPIVMEIEDLVGARSLYQLGFSNHASRVMKWLCESYVA